MVARETRRADDREPIAAPREPRHQLREPDPRRPRRHRRERTADAVGRGPKIAKKAEPKKVSNWKKKIREKDGKPYYVNIKTKKAVWTRPMRPSDAST